MGPLDDVVFTKIGEDSLAVEEIISTIMGVAVKVKTAIPQYTISNIGSRGVRLDNYAEIIVEAELLENCEWGKKGTLVNIEVQKEDKGDHEFRVFYNGASMVIHKTPASADYADLPRVIVIYISAFDIFKEGKMLYETVKVDRESGKPRRSPVTEIYVNTKNLEESAKSKDERMRKISALMKVFRDPDWYDEQFPAFSGRKRELHETEKGMENMSKELQALFDEMMQEKEKEWQQERMEWSQERMEWSQERRKMQQEIDSLHMKLKEKNGTTEWTMGSSGS